MHRFFIPLITIPKLYVHSSMSPLLLPYIKYVVSYARLALYANPLHRISRQHFCNEHFCIELFQTHSEEDLESDFILTERRPVLTVMLEGNLEYHHCDRPETHVLTGGQCQVDSPEKGRYSATLKKGPVKLLLIGMDLSYFQSNFSGYPDLMALLLYADHAHAPMICNFDADLQALLEQFLGYLPANKSDLYNALSTYNKQIIPGFHRIYIGKKRSQQEFLARIAAYVFETTRDDDRFPGVSDIASFLCITSFTLLRRIKEINGQSSRDYVTALRMETAERMLAETELPMNRIAAALAFGSKSYFTTAIHKHFGKTPGEIRREGSKKIPAGKHSGKNDGAPDDPPVRK